MKPIIKSIIENTPSVYSTSILAKEVEKAVEDIITPKRYKNIVDSDMPLYITLLFNTQDNDLIKTLGKNRLAIEIAPELESDHDIYRLQMPLSQVTLPEAFNNCIIFVGTSEYKSKVGKSEQKDSDLPTFTAQEPSRTFDSIILSDNVKERIMRSISIIEHKDIIFDVLEFKKVDPKTKTIICFYGPAGTGKTITAHAIAHYLGKKIMISSYAQIESKYVGEGAKNLRNIFKAAEEQDAVLFMDEADSFLSNRIESTSNGSDKHYNRMSNEMFQLLENFNGCVIFATNLHSDVDPAFKSRIIDSIYFPLPDTNEKVAMLEMMVPSFVLNKVFTPDTNELRDFCYKLKCFSGRDIRKSLLLTYACVAPQIKSHGIDNVIWTKEIFNKGFDSVRETVKIVEDIPVKDVEEFLLEKKFKSKQFEIAKLAVLVDGPELDNREMQLMNELSLSLKGVPLDEKVLTQTESIEKICKDLTLDQKNTLIDTAVRVVTIDGDFSADEHSFISKLCSLLNFSEAYTDGIIAYAESMAASYDLWIKSLEIQQSK